MSKNYDAADIEVLTGLDPVRKRPGMYTDTTRPNHLIQEVVDNSVDEAIAGYAKNIEVILHKDGSATISDDGRGMPTDIHPGEKVSGVEVILTRLHAGGKFSTKNYKFSGGLHGVGVSVVNALSSRLEVKVRRDGKEYAMSFAGGEKKSKLAIVGDVGKRNTGTTIRFWPDPQYFDTVKIKMPNGDRLILQNPVIFRHNNERRAGHRMNHPQPFANAFNEYRFPAPYFPKKRDRLTELDMSGKRLT